MKYLHVNPPWYALQTGLRQPNIPLGAAYCARAALSAGCQVLTWNGDLLPSGSDNLYSQEMEAYQQYGDSKTFDKNDAVWISLIQVLCDFRPDIVGISISTPAYDSALHTAFIVKRVLPETKVVVGGPHVSAEPWGIVNDPNIDVAVVGEGEQTLIALINLWKAGQYPKGIRGRSTKLMDLKDLKWPARGCAYDRYGLLDRDNYGAIMYSRGCPFGCTFCASHNVWRRQTRWRDPKDVVAEMEAIHMEYDTRYFSFEDDTFTLNGDRTFFLLLAIHQSGLPSIPGFRWTCNTRPELLDAKTLKLMKQVNCAAVAVGIESGSPRMLKKMKKSFTVEDVKKAVRMIREAGMITSGQFMIGFPTETEEEMWETVRLAEELECESIMLSVATPLPGTPLFEEAVELKLINRNNVDWSMVTTKNDGILMTVEKDGEFLPMPLVERQRIVSEIKASFDAIQSKTQEAKDASREKYESQYT